MTMISTIFRVNRQHLPSSILQIRNMSILQTVGNKIAENFGGPATSLAAEKDQFSLEQVPNLAGKVAVVTGGSEGVGYGCTKTLLDHGVDKVFILSRDKDKIKGAFDNIKNQVGQEAVQRTEWIQVDLADWKATREAGRKIKSSTDRLDMLILNAGRGIMTYQLDQHGVDLHTSINLIGHVVLTSTLMPLLKKTADNGNTVRVTGLASNLHESIPSDTRFENLQELNRDLGPNQQYGRSKLAVLLYARWLSRHFTPKHPNLLANASHPGFVSTRQSKELIHEAMPVAGYAMSVGMEPFKKDQFEGALSTLYASTATKESGQYICAPSIVEEGSEPSRDPQLAENLMALTTKLIKQYAFDDWNPDDFQLE